MLSCRDIFHYLLCPEGVEASRVGSPFHEGGRGDLLFSTLFEKEGVKPLQAETTFYSQIELWLFGRGACSARCAIGI